VVTLASLDEPNLVPMFNACCRAAAHAARRPAQPRTLPPLPALRGQPLRVRFPEAGLVVDAGPRHYSVVSTHKGGVVAHFVDGRRVLDDAGVVVRDARGRLGSTQSMDAGNRVALDGDTLTVESAIRPMPRRLPTPAQFLLLRVLCLSVFRVRAWREWVKRRLVGLLIAPQRPWPARNVRRIALGPDLAVHDTPQLPDGCARVPRPGAFVAIHMASQGYWQVQDESAHR
jgi:hypothetical protein